MIELGRILDIVETNFPFGLGQELDVALGGEKVNETPAKWAEDRTEYAMFKVNDYLVRFFKKNLREIFGCSSLLHNSHLI